MNSILLGLQENSRLYSMNQYVNYYILAICVLNNILDQLKYPICREIMGIWYTQIAYPKVWGRSINVYIKINNFK